MSNHTLTRQAARIARHMPLVLLALVALLGLCGCVDKTGEPPSEREVLAYVSEKCPTENIELRGVSQTGREPDEYTYTLRSTERDLTFTARSYLRQLYFDATPLGWYEPTVSCDYAEQVHASYDARMTDVLVDSGLYGTNGGGESGEEPRVSTGRIVIRGEKDFAAAARCLARMSDLYAAEAAHNTADWLVDNPYEHVYVSYQPAFAAGDPFDYGAPDLRVASFAIGGTLGEESVLEEIRERYAQLVVDGEIDDELPSGVEEPHRSFLTVHVDGEELVYKRDAAPNDDAAAGHFLLAGQESAYWSDALGTYAMRVDVGVRVTGSGGGEELRCCVFPWFSEDGTWAAERTTSRLFGGSLFTTTYVTPEGIGHTVTVRRDADDVPTSVTHDNGSGDVADLAFDTLETTDAINDYHVVGISVADFAALFDLDYQIDEAQGTVSFR